MFQRSSQKKAFVIKDFPHGCGTQSSAMNHQRSEARGNMIDSDHRHKEDESIDLIMKKAGFNLAVNDKPRFVSAKRNCPPSGESKVKRLSFEETIKLIANQNRGTRLYPRSSSHIKRNTLLVKASSNQRNASTPLRARTHKPTQHRDVLSPREKVLNVLSYFHHVFKELERDTSSRRGESKNAMSNLDFKTRDVLISKGMQLNTQKSIGPILGIKIGDEFRYKSELNLIGLHLGIMGGIDFVYKQGLKLATSVVASEGSGYNDILESNVLIYSGEGGNVMGKDHKKVVEDQKLVNGNLALANSMMEESPVRVIYGRMRSDQRGKRYVYDGLYLVKDYWKEKGSKGNIMFKFKLCRITNQPFVRYL